MLQRYTSLMFAGVVATPLKPAINAEPKAIFT